MIAHSFLAGVYFMLAITCVAMGKPPGVFTAMLAFAMHAYFTLK